jgi:hypothetical protein
MRPGLMWHGPRKFIGEVAIDEFTLNLNSLSFFFLLSCPYLSSSCFLFRSPSHAAAMPDPNASTPTLRLTPDASSLARGPWLLPPGSSPATWWPHGGPRMAMWPINLSVNRWTYGLSVAYAPSEHMLIIDLLSPAQKTCLYIVVWWALLDRGQWVPH